MIKEEKNKYNELVYNRLSNNYDEESEKFFGEEVESQWINYVGDDYARKTDGIFIKLKNGKMLHFDLVEILQDER